MKDFSKLMHGLVVIVSSGLLLLPVSVNAFFVQTKDFADFSLGTIGTNDFQPSVPDVPELSFDSTSEIGSSAGSTSGVSSAIYVLVSDATDSLLGDVSPNIQNDYAESFLQVEMPRTGGAPLVGDDISTSIKVPEPGSILLMGLGLIALLFARIKRG